jgi:UDP-GlcNAc:undecaprenyl-phosphate GlcNAc-1-phosphate transferase
MTWLLAGLALGSFTLCVALLPLVIKLAQKTGFLDLPGPRKIHTEPIAYGGGVAVALAFLLPAIAGIVGAILVSKGHTLGLPAELTRHAPGVLHRIRELVVLLSGAVVICTLGLIDDRRHLGPYTKLAVQFAVAIGFVVGAERLSLFWENSAAGNIVGGAITVLWIVGVTNAFNLLDHMDGLSSGVAAIACAAFAAVAVVTGQWFLAAALATLFGACVGFLCFNFPPAKVFLGDAGSLLLGYLLATLTVTFTFYTKDRGLYTYFLPIAVLAVPLFDTASVMIIRLLRKKPLFVGDKNHLAHRLIDLGMSRRRTVLTIYAITLNSALAAVLLIDVHWLGAALVLSQLVLTFVIITLLEVSGRGNGETS